MATVHGFSVERVVRNKKLTPSVSVWSRYIWVEIPVRLLTGFLYCLSGRGQGFGLDRSVCLP